MADAGVRYLIAVVPQWTRQPLSPKATGGRPLDDRDREFLERMRAEGGLIRAARADAPIAVLEPRRRSELGGLDSLALGALLDDGRRRLEATGIRPRVLVPPFNT
ncbi:MAG: hypothetical protein JO325_05035, partial [Solirubrobacterales bacterium]|nr:hypothetical protein [Solirubrobacterales bacterium]